MDQICVFNGANESRLRVHILRVNPIEAWAGVKSIRRCLVCRYIM